MEQIARIKEMEQRLNNAETAITAMEKAVEQYLSSMEDIRALDSYLGSDAWHSDREADEAGLLPQDLKRGVLTEDAVWNLLERHHEMQKLLKEIIDKEYFYN